MKKILISSILAGMMCATMATAEVYATVDGQKITDKDINALKALDSKFDFSKLTQEQKERVINELVIQRLIVNAAKKDGIEKSKDYKEKLILVKNNLMSELWIKEQQEKILKNIRVTQDDAKKFFESNPSKFILQTAHLRQIVVGKKEDMDKVLSELKGKKGDVLQKTFIELANKYGSPNGGDLGTVERAQLNPSLVDSIFALQPQTYTQSPIQMDGRFIIFYLENKSEEKHMSFAEAEEVIKNFLISQKVAAQMEEKMKLMREKAKVKIEPIK